MARASVFTINVFKNRRGINTFDAYTSLRDAGERIYCGSTIFVWNISGNTAGIISKPITILITYEE